jgi:outer membrane protein OmpA-like peptidoglycan-associated protein
MRSWLSRSGLLALSLLLALPAAVAGEDLTEEEIAEKFARQKTRGLTIAPLEQADPATTAVYEPLPADEQVNIAIRFDFDSAVLRPDQAPRLAMLCAVLKGGAVARLRIVGHTDGTGSPAYNERLSLKRAEAVKRHLAADCAVPVERMEAVGLGARFPLDGADPDGEANRRVEFQALS